ncbi:MAG: hypothetical protein CVV23_08770 [Ignavibacteriae bacterium HGW-Ignavibacteriae-2]|nr:MAG: hypothetical protein CVV23_08770 [Ignavibacteriae bacterium HGW-Ignavibacteriae-2]
MSFEFLLIGIILTIASFTQGFSGFGFQLVALSIITFFIDVKLAIPMCALFGLIINIYLIIDLHKHIKFFELKNLILGSIIGIPAGAFFLSTANPDLIKFLLGFVLILFVLISLGKVGHSITIGDKWAYVFGFFSGLLGGAFNTNGPPVLIYFYLHGWDKYKQKASITGFFIFSSVLIVFSHLMIGLTTRSVLTNFFIYLPFIFIGQIAGKFLFGKISSIVYNKFILLFLFAAGLFMIFG